MNAIECLNEELKRLHETYRIALAAESKGIRMNQIEWGFQAPIDKQIAALHKELVDLARQENKRES
jgi:hypothetical protein